MDDDVICGTCNGSGEGMYEGSRCRHCGGDGVEPTERGCGELCDADGCRTGCQG